MTGYQYQHDPAKLFQEWIQKGGKAQAEFMKNFGAMMTGQTSQNFDPLRTLNSIADKAAQTQSQFMENVASAQSKGFEKMLSFEQTIPNFLNWGAYKTSVGSNGRISIPEAERDALGLSEGDLVQVIILPIAKKSKNKEVKK